MRVYFSTWLLACFVMPSMAAEIEASIKGANLNWLSAVQTSNGLEPAMWELPLHLPSAERVIPGSPAEGTPTSIRMNALDGSYVNLPLEIIGVSYRLSPRDTDLDDTVSGRAKVRTSGNEVVVIGTGVGDRIFTFSTASSPFTHYRPILDIDTKEWMAKFTNANARRGTYRGVLNYAIPYNYYRNGIAIRNTLQASIVVTLAYSPEMLTSVKFMSGTGLKIINPQYIDFPERKVGGIAHYRIEAKGFFPNGVYIRLRPPLRGNDLYQLDSLSANDKSSILYNVYCSLGCDNQPIITAGHPDLNMTDKYLIMKSNNETSAQATISVKLVDTALSALINDTYSGSFVLFFEAGF